MKNKSNDPLARGRRRGAPFSLFAIIGSGIEVAGYGTILLAAGLPVYFWVTRRNKTLPGK